MAKCYIREIGIRYAPGKRFVTFLPFVPIYVCCGINYFIIHFKKQTQWELY